MIGWRALFGAGDAFGSGALLHATDARVKIGMRGEELVDTMSEIGRIVVRVSKNHSYMPGFQYTFQSRALTLFQMFQNYTMLI